MKTSEQSISGGWLNAARQAPSRTVRSPRRGEAALGASDETVRSIGTAVADGDPALLRAGAVAAVLGPVVTYLASVFHGGGDDPSDLPAALPHYAANPNWEEVHVGQFAGFALMAFALVALHRSLQAGRGAVAARAASDALLVALAIYAVNQAVDGVAIRHVAEAWASAPAAEQGTALRIAEAVRHVEIGLSGFSELVLGAALLLSGLAIATGSAYPKWLGWAAVVTGGSWAVLGTLVARDGFTHLTLTTWSGLLLAVWMLALAAQLWRRSRTGPVRERGASAS